MRKLILAIALLMCGTAGWAVFAMYDQPKQEKAQPAKSAPTEPKWTKDGNITWQKIGPLPFDLPAKEWDGPDTHAKDTCGPPDDTGLGACEAIYIPVPTHHVSCKDVAPDWKQRVLLQTADGKEHCYNFNLIEKP